LEAAHLFMSRLKHLSHFHLSTVKDYHKKKGIVVLAGALERKIVGLSLHILYSIKKIVGMNNLKD
jgi:hypothetical protein